MVEASAGTFRDILVFELDQQRYGLPLGDVMETVRAVTITPLPQAPPLVEGIINFRGRVVPVLDIRARFHQAPREMKISDHLILARAGGRSVALRVDRVTDLVRIGDQDLSGAEKIGPGLDTITGVARLADGLVLLHDLGAFLTAAEAENLSQSLAAAGKG